jgi:hypothetical protein
MQDDEPNLDAAAALLLPIRCQAAVTARQLGQALQKAMRPSTAAERFNPALLVLGLGRITTYWD